MKYFLCIMLYLSVLQINAADKISIQNDSDDIFNANQITELATDPKDNASSTHIIEMHELDQSLPQENLSRLNPPSFTDTKSVAQYLTQIAHGDTIVHPTFCTNALRKQLKIIKTANPTKYNRILQELETHKTKATRGINIAGATEALQKEITPEMVNLFMSAWQTSHTEQTGTIEEKERAAQAAKTKFWYTAGTLGVTLVGGIVAAVFAGTGTC